MTTYSNPRTEASFDDWPIGGSNRGECRFQIETHPKRGQRATRVTTNKHGQWCKPRKATYSSVVRIVDGDDGKTYIAEHSTMYGAVSIMDSALKFQVESASETHDPERYEELLELFS